MLSTLANTLRKRVTQALPGKQPSYRIFDVQLKRRIALSPSLTRLVFSGPDVAEMTTLAPDQRVKLLFPAPDGSRPNLSNERHWKAAHSALPADQRPPHAHLHHPRPAPRGAGSGYRFRAAWRQRPRFGLGYPRAGG